MKIPRYQSDNMYLLALVLISITKALFSCMIMRTKKSLQTMIFLKEKLLLLLNFLEKSVQSMVDIFMVVTRRADTEKSILCFVTQYLMRKVFLITTLNSLKSAIRGAKIDPHHVPLVMLRRKILSHWFLMAIQLLSHILPWCLRRML